VKASAFQPILSPTQPDGMSCEKLDSVARSIIVIELVDFPCGSLGFRD
jgi:hypothetical protein